MTQKSPVVKKKVFDISPSIWDFILQDFYSGSSMILYNNVPGKKKFAFSEKCMGNNGSLQQWKEDA